VQELIRREALERQPFSQRVEMPSHEQIKDLMEKSVSRFFAYAQETGIVSQEMMSMLDQFSSPSNIVIASNGTESIRVLGSEVIREDFPDNPKEGAKIYVNPFVMKFYAELYLEFAKKEGILLNPVHLRNAVIGAIAAHERAHILEGAMRTKLISLVVGDEGYNNRLAFSRSRSLLFRHAEILENETITNAQPQIKQIIDAERLGAGFELIALDFFLKEFGVNDAVREKLVETVHRVRARSRGGIQQILEKLYAKGFDDYDIQVFVSDIRALAQEMFDEETVIDICVPAGLTFWRSIGYLHPNKPEELWYILQGSFEDITPEYAKEVLLSEENTE
jgi:hypothetical protein